MDVKYQITKVLLMIVFWSLQGVIPEMWELYLFYAYAFYGIFFHIEPHLIFLGLGYTIARISVYFKVKSSINT